MTRLVAQRLVTRKQVADFISSQSGGSAPPTCHTLLAALAELPVSYVSGADSECLPNTPVRQVKHSRCKRPLSWELVYVCMYFHPYFLFLFFIWSKNTPQWGRKVVKTLPSHRGLLSATFIKLYRVLTLNDMSLLFDMTLTSCFTLPYRHTYLFITQTHSWKIFMSPICHTCMC